MIFINTTSAFKQQIVLTQYFFKNILEDILKNIIQSDDNNTISITVIENKSSGCCSHGALMSPSQIKLLQTSDLVISFGAKLDIDKNSSLKTKIIDLSCSIKKIKDIKSNIDCHWWVSPKRMLTAIEYLKCELIKKYPKSKNKIENNFLKVQKDLESLDKKLKSNIYGKKYYAFHNMFAYLDEDYGTRAVYSFDNITPKVIEKIKTLGEKNSSYPLISSKTSSLEKIYKNTVELSISGKSYKEIIDCIIKYMI